MPGYNKRILALMISSFILPNALHAETLREAVAATMRTNPEIQIAAKQRSADNEQVPQAQSGYYPSIDINAGYGRESADNFSSNFQSDTLWRTDLGITARQPVFDGWATRNDVKRTKAKTNADAYRVWGTAEDQALATVQTYLDILRNEELVAVARKNVGSYERAYSTINNLNEKGVGTEADVNQSSGRVDLARSNLKSAENSLMNARIAFQKVTGFFPQRLDKVPDVDNSVLPKSENEAVQRALAKHPILKSANADIVQAQGQYNASKSKFYPRIDFVLSGLQSKNVGGARGPDIDRLAELQLNYNILQGGKDLARTRETAYQVQQATEIRNRSQYQVIELVKLSWEAYVSAERRMPDLRRHVTASESTTGAYKRQFQVGKRTVLDVLDSQNEYYTAEQDLINERYALLLAKYRLLNSEGKLVEHLGISLPEEACIPYHDLSAP